MLLISGRDFTFFSCKRPTALNAHPPLSQALPWFLSAAADAAGDQSFASKADTTQHGVTGHHHQPTAMR
jgi:hypothetical protein